MDQTLGGQLQGQRLTLTLYFFFLRMSKLGPLIEMTYKCNLHLIKWITDSNEINSPLCFLKQ